MRECCGRDQVQSILGKDQAGLTGSQGRTGHDAGSVPLVHRLGCKEEAVAHNMLSGFNESDLNSIGLGGKAAVGAAVEISEFEMAPVVVGGGLI
jgi:hypothetical protein